MSKGRKKARIPGNPHALVDGSSEVMRIIQKLPNVRKVRSGRGTSRTRPQAQGKWRAAIRRFNNDITVKIGNPSGFHSITVIPESQDVLEKLSESIAGALLPLGYIVRNDILRTWGSHMDQGQETSLQETASLPLPEWAAPVAEEESADVSSPDAVSSSSALTDSPRETKREKLTPEGAYEILFDLGLQAKMRRGKTSGEILLFMKFRRGVISWESWGLATAVFIHAFKALREEGLLIKRGATSNAQWVVVIEEKKAMGTSDASREEVAIGASEGVGEDSVNGHVSLTPETAYEIFRGESTETEESGNAILHRSPRTILKEDYNTYEIARCTGVLEGRGLLGKNEEGRWVLRSILHEDTRAPISNLDALMGVPEDKLATLFRDFILGNQADQSVKKRYERMSAFLATASRVLASCQAEVEVVDDERLRLIIQHYIRKAEQEL